MSLHPMFVVDIRCCSDIHGRVELRLASQEIKQTFLRHH